MQTRAGCDPAGSLPNAPPSTETTAMAGNDMVILGGVLSPMLGDRDSTSRYYDGLVTMPVKSARVLKVDGSDSAPPCNLGWSDVSYSVRVAKTPATPDGKKSILSGVSGRCCAGELTAILGPSGSGKTTLLDILADRISSGTISGTIELNGTRRNVKSFRSMASYVAQEDALLGSFTVVETLRMAAKLSLPNTVTDGAIEDRVQRAIDEMGLRSCDATIVGDIFRKGLSGGQKRRLSIAIELLSNPSILLLDEPTSGLDATSTYNVMKCIARLCEVERTTVVCSIHQPSSSVYEMFSNIGILSGGQTVYFGPRRAAHAHFASIGFQCPPYTNPAEYFIELVNADFEGHADIKKLVGSYASSSASASLESWIIGDRNTITESSPLLMDPPSSWRQFKVLMYRNSLNNIRNPGIYWVRLFMYFMLSFMVGTMYLSTNKNLSEEDIVPLLFYIQAFLVFMSVAVLPFFIEQRSVFVRERANSSLSVASYVMANFLASLPGILLIAAMSTALVVLLAELNGLVWFLLNLFLSLVVAESLMHVIGSAVPHYIIGIALGAGLFGMFMLCEGFMVPRESIPDYWIWGYYMAFHSYSFESFVFEHFSRESSPMAAAILKRLGMEDVDTPRNMIILCGYVVVLQAMFTFILHKFHTGRR